MRAAYLVVVERLAHRGGDCELNVTAGEEPLDRVEHRRQPISQLKRRILEPRVRSVDAARARWRGGLRGSGHVAAPLEQEEDEADHLRVQLVHLARRRGGEVWVRRVGGWEGGREGAMR